LERVVAGLVERHAHHRNRELAADPIEWPGAHLYVAVVDLRVQRVPEILDETGENTETGAQSRESVAP
jgi:hypothetical protein